MGIVKAICRSDKRGTQKYEVPEADLIAGFGIDSDAHAGNWHRQVSLLQYETREAFNARGAETGNGDFAENLLVSGIDLVHLPIGTLLCIAGTVMLEVTQIGKECHHHCQIYQKMGECIMPKNGIFAQVITGGHIKKNDIITVMNRKAEEIDSL
ncbi:MAG: MOSC domain-containing protein [Treponema sp.]